MLHFHGFQSQLDGRRTPATGHSCRTVAPTATKGGSPLRRSDAQHGASLRSGSLPFEGLVRCARERAPRDHTGGQAWRGEKLVLHRHRVHPVSVDGNEDVQSPEDGEIIEPGGVSPGVTGRTGEPILPSPPNGAPSHRPGREPSGAGRGRRTVSPFSGLGSFFAIHILGAHAPSFTMSPLRGCEDRPVA